MGIQHGPLTGPTNIITDNHGQHNHPPTKTPHTPYHQHKDASSPLNNPQVRPPIRRQAGGHERAALSKGQQSEFQPAMAIPCIIEARSFEELHTERCYLNAQLATQGQRSTELMRHLLTLQGRFAAGVVGEQRRKATKQIYWAKSKVKGSLAQEKVIFARLGELYAEEQARERWMRVQNEHSSPSPDLFVPDLSVMSPVLLDATSPTFIPSSDYLSPPYPCEEDRASTTTAGENTTRSPQPEPCEIAGPLANASLLSFEYESREAAEQDLDDSKQCDGVMGMGSEAIPPLVRQRRMSLPSMRCIWPDAEQMPDK